MLTKDIKFNKKIIQINYRDESDLSVIDEIFVDKMYRCVEPIILNTKYHILDIGAHIGLFSIYASILNPDAIIIALEPEQENYALMKENVKLNHCKNITTKQLALSGSDEKTVPLYVNENSHNHSTLTPKHLTTLPPDHTDVPATSLENLLAQPSFAMATAGKVGLLKMDIEGAEYDIIENMEDGTWNMIENIIVEYHEFENKNRAVLEDIIRKHGFSVEHFPNHYDKRFGLLLCRNKGVHGS